jgi:hypothetical protein
MARQLRTGPVLRRGHAHHGGNPKESANKRGHRLNKRGEEICYRLFDIGETPCAVARLMGAITAPHTLAARSGQP